MGKACSTCTPHSPALVAKAHVPLSQRSLPHRSLVSPGPEVQHASGSRQLHNLAQQRAGQLSLAGGTTTKHAVGGRENFRSGREATDRLCTPESEPAQSSLQLVLLLAMTKRATTLGMAHGFSGCRHGNPRSM